MQQYAVTINVTSSESLIINMLVTTPMYVSWSSVFHCFSIFTSFDSELPNSAQKPILDTEKLLKVFKFIVVTRHQRLFCFQCYSWATCIRHSQSKVVCQIAPKVYFYFRVYFV